jgi:hypothetical protein
MIVRTCCAVLLLAALALFASSSAAAPRHIDEPLRPLALAWAPEATVTATIEESCTGMLWEWVGPYWDMGDAAAPPGLDARYRACLHPWYPSSAAWVGS